MDHFAVVGLPRTYELDVMDLERRYKEMSKKLHPDRFARADARARRASLSRSVALNEAWRTLRDPVRRGEYLLLLSGIEVGGEEGTKRLGPQEKSGKSGKSGKSERLPVPQELLMEVMELRETLAEARMSNDQPAIDALAADVADRRARALSTVSEGFAAQPAHLARVAAALVEVRYFDRFLQEVAAHGEAQAEAAGGTSRPEVSHGG